MSSTCSLPAERVIMTRLKNVHGVKRGMVWLASVPSKCKWFGCQDSMPRPAPDTHTYPNLPSPLVFLLTLQTNMPAQTVRRSRQTNKHMLWQNRCVRVCGWRWESEYVSKSLVFALIGLEAVSCSQTAAEQGGYRLCMRLRVLKWTVVSLTSTQNSECSHCDPVIA